ncbi:response regulator [Desulfuribacillus alkaliarsenatis]|uniref:Response regulatory domain-containing protein n=1 Tax=Desulfuribacillus alkaliarsenatis TaxID=766136 RepID=A0A1E5G1H0_9FIRM|nr:response regulator [Desulfuribacillus alkaliarsenatis]OEF96757.1 hypothetical protein BHF68_06710 [Desulfuribacillus alkaliarsenatis]
MNKKVLIVDDQAGIRMLLSEVLRSEGVEVVDVPNGEIAIQVCPKLQPDLVLLDMKMPGMSGVDTLRYLRKELDLDVPVILMTAYSELEMLEEAIRLGINRQIMKPFDVFSVSKEIVHEVCKTPSFCG